MTKLLEDYSLEEILEMNDITPEEALEALVSIGITLHVPKACDYGYS